MSFCLKILICFLFSFRQKEKSKHILFFIMVSLLLRKILTLKTYLKNVFVLCKKCNSKPVFFPPR